MVPPLVVQLLVNGVLAGAIFALCAYGMALVWGVMNIINIAQGEFIVLGGFITVLLADAGLHPLFGIIAAPVVLYGVGFAIYHTVIRRVVSKDIFVSLLATFGVSILLQQLMNQIFGADIRRARHSMGNWAFFDGIVTVDHIKLVAALVALAVAIVLVTFLKRSRLGQAIRERLGHDGSVVIVLRLVAGHQRLQADTSRDDKGPHPVLSAAVLGSDEVCQGQVGTPRRLGCLLTQGTDPVQLFGSVRRPEHDIVSTSTGREESHGRPGLQKLS